MIEPMAAARNDAPMPSSSRHERRPELVHRPQSHVLDPDRARTDEFQGVHIDLLNVVSLGRRCAAAEVGVSGEPLGGDVLGVRFERRRAIGRQLQLAAEDLLDTPAQRRPVALGGIEVASQIEQGPLAHFVADAFGAHEPGV